ncbi:MAG: sulfur carrier protein ThiS [Psychroflexus halocasei]
MITIQVNEKPLEIDTDFNILQLLTLLKSPQDGIAVAVNNTIISKNSWASKTLSDHDSILIIQATQGG